MWIGEIDNSKDMPTLPTDKLVIMDAIEKLEAMYKYVQSCHSCRDITWEKFQARLSVGSVGNKKKSPADSEKDDYSEPTDPKSSVVSGSPDTCLQVNQAQATDQVQATAPSDNLSTPSVDGVKEKTGSGPHPRKDAISTDDRYVIADPREQARGLHISTNDTYHMLKNQGYEAYDGQDGQLYFRQPRRQA